MTRREITHRWTRLGSLVADSRPDSFPTEGARHSAVLAAACSAARASIAGWGRRRCHPVILAARLAEIFEVAPACVPCPFDRLVAERIVLDVLHAEREGFSMLPGKRGEA